MLNLFFTDEIFPIDGATRFEIVMLIIVGGLLVLASIFAGIISIILFIKYYSYNRKDNSQRKSGSEIAREILDENGLNKIKVKKTGSIMFGNSYSHYFKKIRLRRLIFNKESVTSLAMAYEKSCLAILDKEGDQDMKKRNKLTPFIYFGPILFVPLVILGILIDIVVFSANSLIFTVICIFFGLIVYVLSFVMSLVVLKVEKKAQKKAIELMERNNLPAEEIESCKELYKLYNIEYVNDMIIALLELIYRVLQIIIQMKSESSPNSN